MSLGEERLFCHSVLLLLPCLTRACLLKKRWEEWRERRYFIPRFPFCFCGVSSACFGKNFSIRMSRFAGICSLIRRVSSPRPPCEFPGRGGVVGSLGGLLVRSFFPRPAIRVKDGRRSVRFVRLGLATLGMSMTVHSMLDSCDIFCLV